MQERPHDTECANCIYCRLGLNYYLCVVNHRRVWDGQTKCKHFKSFI